MTAGALGRESEPLCACGHGIRAHGLEPGSCGITMGCEVCECQGFEGARGRAAEPRCLTCGQSLAETTSCPCVATGSLWTTPAPTEADPRIPPVDPTVTAEEVRAAVKAGEAWAAAFSGRPVRVVPRDPVCPNCKLCGQPTMHIGDVCFPCNQKRDEGAQRRNLEQAITLNETEIERLTKELDATRAKVTELERERDEAVQIARGKGPAVRDMALELERERDSARKERDDAKRTLAVEMSRYQECDRERLQALERATYAEAILADVAKPILAMKEARRG